MDGMLSQDEINALLSGIDSPTGSEEQPAAEAASEIDESLLTSVEKDAVGEIANISMGSSATTLFSLVNRKVNITTPEVSLAKWEDVVGNYERPCVFIQIKYTAGLDGSNLMVLKEHDVKVITDLMMGGDGSNTDGELGELHLSAISEAMNQMMGAAATSMSTMLGRMIDISPPEARLVDLDEFKQGGEIASFLDGTFVKIAFRMQIDDLVDSSIVQLYTIDFAKGLYDTFIAMQTTSSEPASAPAPGPAPQTPPAAEMLASQPSMAGAASADPQMNMQAGMPMMNGGMQMGMPMMNGGMQMGMPMMNGGMQMSPQMMPTQNMNIQPAQFQSFAGNTTPMPGDENIGLIRDVPLDVTVELGRTKKSIAEILDFAPGTIIELDKIAGEPIDVLVNGKFVARGEVVVIEESFGVRVTEIVK